MDPIELYAATLGEVKRQAARLGAAEEAGGAASGGSSSDGSGGWVVLESGSTPAQLPGAAGCSLWPQQQWAVAYDILVRAFGSRDSLVGLAGRVCTPSTWPAPPSCLPRLTVPPPATLAPLPPAAVLPVPARGGGPAPTPGRHAVFCVHR